VIVIDPSALVAILKNEPEADDFIRIINEAGRCFLSAAGLLEASMVVIGGGLPERVDGLTALLAESRVEIVPFDEAQSLAGRDAFVRFGKGRHPAGLNFGDCMSYALAKTRGLPLLYKGVDFPKTDIVAATSAGA
jgi:ribonuclease VapC